MSAAPVPTHHVYVVKINPTADGSAGLAGRVEHVSSGRRHDFDSSQALIDCLLSEEREVARQESKAPGIRSGFGVL